MKYSLAISGIAPDPAEDHLMADGTMQDIVQEGVGNVGLKLYGRAGRKGISPLPVYENQRVSP